MKKDLRILTVEDESAVAHLLALVLCGPHCQVFSATDGEDGLAKVATSSEPYDIIITDHKMPRMTGLEMVRKLRARNYSGKIVILSAFLNEATVEEYRTLGVDLMLDKPFDMDELRRAIDVLADEAAALAQRATH